MSKFISNYINDFQDLVSSSNEYIDHIEQIISCINSVSEKGKKCIIVGNGGSAAKTVAELLVINGVSSSKISTVSYGEEKPAVSGSNENSWSQNRRALIKTF